MEWIKQSKLYIAYLENDSEITLEDITTITPKEFLFTLPFPRNYDILKMIKIINYWDVLLPECYLLLNYDPFKNKEILEKELITSPEGHKELLNHFIEFIDQPGLFLLDWSLEHNYLECLIYLYKYTDLFKYLGKYVIKYNLEKASQNGSLECLKFLNEKFPNTWDESITESASKNGHLNCLIYAHENGCTTDVLSTDAAIKRGHLDCLIYLCKNGYKDENLINISVSHERLECLIYLHSIKIPWKINTMEIAAKVCNYEILKYLHENGCPWDEEVGKILTYNTRVIDKMHKARKCLMYYLENMKK